jgi:peptidoglycan/LPS O-acetylase OafA/YrhL
MGYFSGVRVPGIGRLGDEAVLAFFVLSGLVISYSAKTKHPDSIDFILARLSRLWSIMIPAVLLTIMLDTVGQKLSPSAYGNLHSYNLVKWTFSAIANALFVSQIWNLDIWVGSNGPFWSVCYEAWYYFMFAAAFYFTGWHRFVLVMFCFALAGPKIIIALPVWLEGVAVYWLVSKYGCARGWLGITIWWASILLVAGYAILDMSSLLNALFPGTKAMARGMWDADFWPKSYLIGLIIAMNLYGFDAVSAPIQGILRRIGPLAQRLADGSFGLYLFHYPIGYFTRAVCWNFGLTSGCSFVLMIYFVTFAVAFFLALLFDPIRKPLRRLLSEITSGVPLQLTAVRKLK